MQREIQIQALPLFQRIRDNHPNIHYMAYYLEYLTFHLPEAKLLPALEWLVKNRLTGEKFLEFIQGDCRRSGLELIRQLTMRLEREKKTRTLTVKDIQ